VREILERYKAFGLDATVIAHPNEEAPLPTRRIPWQRSSDYEYITHLAKEAGHVFYLEPGPAPGTSTAYWGPEIRTGAPQPALTTGMDALNNVEQLSFSFDRERKATPVVHYQEEASKRAIPVSIAGADRTRPSLGRVQPRPVRIEKLGDTGQLSSAGASMRRSAYLTQHDDSVFGSGRLDVARYGRLLRSRRLVGVRGAGLAFDGLYYVASVTHDIERGSYKQGFELARDALATTVPVVSI
jgi:hypothetical protein